MKPQKAKKAKQTLRKRFVKSPSYSISCADEIRIRVTEQSFLMTFSVAIDFAQTEDGATLMTLEDQGGLMIAPRHAKRLAKALVEAVGKYEQDVGVIQDKEAEALGKPH